MKILVYGGQRDSMDHLRNIVMSACPKATLLSCFDSSSAIKQANENQPDMAFLSMENNENKVFRIGKKLREMNSALYLVICADSSDYALDAFRIHASGYLLQPASEDIKKEASYYSSIQNLSKKKRIYAQTFGNFDVFLDGKVLEFTRAKSKEILAYLIDRKGCEVTAEQLCCILWEGEGRDRSRLKQLYVFVGDLKRDLRTHGLDNLVIKTKLGYAVDRREIDCDYYQLLDGNKSILSQYNGDYMNQYSWAEYTNAYLSEQSAFKNKLSSFYEL